MKSLQRFNSIEWASLLNVSPIYHEFESVTMGPVTHQLPGCPGGNVSSEKLTFKIKRGLLPLKLDMEMWRMMISEYNRIMIPKKVEMIGMAVF